MPSRDAVAVGDARENNFDLLRIGASLLVLVSHAFALTGGAEPTIAGVTLGTAAVFVFFGISGFLVTLSWQREPRVGRWLLKRVLRLFPALIVVLVLSALVLGPVVTERSLGSYLTDATPWRYIAQNLVMYRMTFDLPGVFLSNPYPVAVNGSLWTMRSELHAYLGLALLGVAGLLDRRWVATALLLATMVGVHVLSDPVLGYVGTPTLFTSFAAGVLLALWRRELPWRWPIALAGLAVWLLAPLDAYVVGSLVVPYLALMAAYRLPPVAGWLAGRDASYGTYLYAFPVQQAVALAWPSASVLGMIAVSLPITLALASLSWVWVERPALRLKATRVSGRTTGRDRAILA